MVFEYYVHYHLHVYRAIVYLDRNQGEVDFNEDRDVLISMVLLLLFILLFLIDWYNI